MATVVQIEVRLDGSQVTGGIQKITGGLQQAGRQGNVVFTRMAKDAQKARDATEFLAQTLGIQVPRSIQKLLTQLPGVSTALAGAFRVGMVTLFIGALVQAINNFDLLKQKFWAFTEGVYEAGQRMWAAITGGQSQVVLQKAQNTALKLNQGLTDAVDSMWDQAKLSGKEGIAAVEAQARQMVEQVQRASQKMLQQAREEYGGESETYRQAKLFAGGNLAQAQVAAEKWKNAQLAKLRREDLANLLQMQNEAQIASLTGLQKVLAQEQAEILKTQSAGRGHPADIVAAEVAAIREKTTAQIQQMGEDWFDSIDKSLAQIATQGAGGFAKVEIETQAKILAATREFNKQWGETFVGDPNDPEFQARMDAWANAFLQLNRQVNAITASGAAERRKMMADVTGETAAGHERAATASVNPLFRGQAEALASYHDAVRQIDQWETQLLAGLRKDSDDYVFIQQQAQQRRLDAWAQASAQIADEQRMLRDQLAGELEGVFDDITSGNIGRRILTEIKRFFAQIVASWILSMTRMRGAAAGIGGGGLLGSLLGGLFGMGGGNSNMVTIPGAGPIPLFGGGGAANNSIIIPGGAAVPLFGGLSAGAGTAGAAQQQAAQTMFGSILQTQLGKIFTHGLSLGKFKIGGAQLGMLGAGIALESILGGYATASPLGGAIGGALGGAMLGTSILPGIGTAIGAVVGAIAGLFGGIFGGRKRRHQAEDYMKQNVDPALKDIVKAYKAYQLDGQAALEQIRQLEEQARQALQPLGKQGSEVFQQWGSRFREARDTINSFDAERQRRNVIDFAPAQFARGGIVPGPIGAPQLAVVHGGEKITPAPAAQSSGDIQIHFHTLDAQSFDSWLRNGGARKIRQAVLMDKLAYSGGN